MAGTVVDSSTFVFLLVTTILFLALYILVPLPEEIEERQKKKD
jgi:hypothetical protein